MKRMNNKVKIICCYYGKFPEYFKLWLWTCGNNLDFDFMLVTDEQVENAPDNVYVYNISFLDLKDKISKCLGKKIKLEKPYKLCDYKPVYGLAFADELKDYDFWGQCDLDMLWGNLRAEITDEILDNYDIVGQRGALILYRNCERINHLYQLDGGVFSSDYVFSHAESCGFDEMTGMNRISEKHGISRYKDLHIADAIRENTRLNIRGTEKCKEFFCMKDGKLFRAYEDNMRGLMADEYLYLHMSGKLPAVHITSVDYDNFYIKGNCIEKRLEKEFSQAELDRENEFKSADDESQQSKDYKRKRLFDMIFRYPFSRKIILFRIHLALLKHKH